MQIVSFDIEGFRSLRDLGAEMGGLTLLVGPNGVGKSNLYRALELLKLACHGQLAYTFAEEGGVSAVLWSGQRLKGKTREIRIHITWDELEYELLIGATSPNSSPFPEDPFIKSEKIWARTGRRVEMVRRAAQIMKYRDDNGLWRTYPHELSNNESLLAQLREPQKFPICLRLHNVITRWRFYHTFRTDRDSPLRQPQPVYRTTSLNSDGSNLGAMLLSIQKGKNSERLSRTLAEAFPNSNLHLESNVAKTYRSVGMTMDGFQRSFSGVELSDGTLRFYALAAALYGEEPANFLVLNEPETSLHQSTFGALSRAIKFASSRSQILLVTHSAELAEEVGSQIDVPIRTLRWDRKRGTRIDDQLVISDQQDLDSLNRGNDDPYDEEMNESES